MDRADHLCTSYNFTRKTLKLWCKMFFWLLEVLITIVNSYILYNAVRVKKGSKKLEHLMYRKLLINELVGTLRRPNRKCGRPSSKNTAKRLNQKQHFMGQNPGKPKDCAVCSNRSKGKRKKTMYYCKTCSRKPGPHPADCFEEYHTKSNYNNYSH